MNNFSLYNYNKLNWNTIASLINLFIKSTENDNQQHQHKRAYFLKMKIWKKIIKLRNEIEKELT